MNIRTKLLSVAASLHGLLFVLCYVFFIHFQSSSATQSIINLPDNVLLFVVMELALIISLFIFWRLITKATEPLLYVDLFKNIIKEQEFNSRFSISGHKEIDELMVLFNEMLQQLYDERLKLGDRQAMLQGLLDAIPVSILVLDFDDNINQINPAAEHLLALQAESTLYHPFASIDHPLLRQLTVIDIDRPVVINQDNAKRYRCSLHRFVDRGFERKFIIIQELTQELRASERNTYHKLIRLMSHEVNNTMAATGSVLKSCLHYSNQIDQDDREDYETAMKLVIERTNSLNTFMSEYAQVVRLPQPTLEQCNLYHLLLMTQKLFANKMSARNINFYMPDRAIEKHPVLADQNQLERVFINIVKNSIEAIEHDGEIQVSFAVNRGSLSLQIADTGPGIKSDDQQALFTPFFTTKAQGQGIGLMLVAEILQEHQFDYKLNNRTDSKGSVFTITFS